MGNVPSLKATIAVVIAYLKEQGFQADKAEEKIRNGHWLLRTCEMIHEGGICPACVPDALTAMFSLLEGAAVYTQSGLTPKGRSWNRGMTNQALKAGHFPVWEDA